MPTPKRTRQQHLTIGNLSDAQRDHLRLIGGGNLTEGIRRLLDQAQEQPKWETKFCPMSDPHLNALGLEGWELVTMFTWNEMLYAAFKRRVVTPDAREAKERMKNDRP